MICEFLFAIDNRAVCFLLEKSTHFLLTTGLVCFLEELAKKQPEIIEFDEDELSLNCGSENNEPLEAIDAADVFLIKAAGENAVDLEIE